ncbi:MAG: hypothetical protein QOK28_2665 [Actinomycetota bacterium]
MVVVAVAILASCATSGADGATDTSHFTGTVDSAGARTQVKSVKVTATGAVDAVLDWTNTAADLNVVVKNPAGTVVASSTSRTAKPERVHAVVSTTGTWKFAVSARTAASDFTLDVTVTSGDPDTSGWDGSIKTWAAENEDARHDWTRDEAVDQASHFDAILSSTYPPDYIVSYKDNVAAMKAVNPDLLLMAHVNGSHVWEHDDRVAWPPESFLYDANGQKILQPAWDTWLMNVFDKTWVDRRPNECLEILDLTGYDSCYLDSLATWALQGNTAMPINPNTGKQITGPEWLRATTEVAKHFRAAIAPRVTWGSGGATGAKYFGTSPANAERQLLDGLDASVHEGFCRRPGASLDSFYGEAQWKQDVDMIRDVESHGKYALPLAKTFTTGTMDRKRAVMKYCLATFLLATNGKSMFGFEFGSGNAMTTDSLWDTVLGAPTSGYAKTDGVYQRSFADGRVLVNSTTTPATVDLGGSYRRPEGTTVTSLALPAHTAEILTKA